MEHTRGVGAAAGGGPWAGHTETQKRGKAQPHATATHIPEAPASPHLEKRGVRLLPRKICCPSRFPGGWGAGVPSSVNAARPPQPPAPLGPPPRLLPGAPAPHSGAEPTSRTPRPGGGRFRRAPRGGGRPTPFRPRCARHPARSPRPPPGALESPLQTWPAGPTLGLA